MERHTLFADRPLAEFLEWIELVIDTINDALTGIDPSNVRLHVCWGNYEGPHTHDVPLDDILPSIYRARVGALVVSMANARHEHEYKCFARQPLPDGMSLVAGVIDTTNNYVEHPEVVADRLERIATPSATRIASWRAPTAASTRPPGWATSRRHSCGRSSVPCARARISPRRDCSEQRLTKGSKKRRRLPVVVRYRPIRSDRRGCGCARVANARDPRPRHRPHSSHRLARRVDRRSCPCTSSNRSRRSTGRRRATPFLRLDAPCVASSRSQQDRSACGTQPPVGNGRGEQVGVAGEHQPAAPALTRPHVVIGWRQCEVRFRFHKNPMTTSAAITIPKTGIEGSFLQPDLSRPRRPRPVLTTTLRSSRNTSNRFL